MILKCVKQAISYKCPYIIIAVVVHYQIYTVAMVTICANVPEKKCLDLEYSVTSPVTSLKRHGLCGYEYKESPFKISLNKWTNGMRVQTVKQVCNHKTHGLRNVFCTGTKN